MTKYKAKPTWVDGIRFASKAESERYQFLKILLNTGEIMKLGLQPKFPLYSKSGEKIGNYIADFIYETPEGKTVVEDVKGVATPMYRWKKKHFLADYKELHFAEIKCK